MLRSSPVFCQMSLLTMLLSCALLPSCASKTYGGSKIANADDSSDGEQVPEQPEAHTDMTFKTDDHSCNSSYFYYARGVDRMNLFAEILQESFESDKGALQRTDSGDAVPPKQPATPSVYSWAALTIFNQTGGEVFGDRGKTDHPAASDLTKFAVFLRDCYVYKAP